MTVVIDGTTGITSPADSLSGNLTFTGTGNRITGDFSNATIANRVAFQTSTANGNTVVGVIPNGTGLVAGNYWLNNSDPTNAGAAYLRASTTDITFQSTISGTGTYLPMTFYTGGSERMRIDTSGNLNLGQTSGSYRFNASAASAPNGVVAQFTNSGSTGCGIDFNQTGVDDFALTMPAGTGGLRFVASGTNERMRIDSSGNLLVGTTSANFSPKFAVTSGASDNTTVQVTGNYTAFHVVNSSNTSYTPMKFWNNGVAGTVGSISCTTSATSYSTSSDYRLKENIKPMTGALSVVQALKPCTYTWKSDGSDGQGFIAHELQAVVPDCVTGEKDAVDENGNPVYQGIDTSFLVATLTAAIQEQQAIIEALRADVEQLKGKA